MNLKDYLRKPKSNLVDGIMKTLKEESHLLDFDFDHLPKPPEYRRDCFYFWEEQDMGARIPCCTLRHALGDCPCSPTCKDYISGTEVYEVVRNYQNAK